MILWIIIAILWTVLVAVTWYLDGKKDGKKEAEAERGTVTYNVANPEVSEEMREQLLKLWTAYNDGVFICAFDSGSMRRLKTLWEEHEVAKNAPDGGNLEERVKALEDIDKGYQDRFTRVERKAGLSV